MIVTRANMELASTLMNLCLKAPHAKLYICIYKVSHSRHALSRPPASRDNTVPFYGDEARKYFLLQRGLKLQLIKK